MIFIILATMPIINVQLNISLSEDSIRNLQLSLTSLISSVMNKPQKDVMVTVNQSYILMGCDCRYAAFIDLRYITELAGNTTEKLSTEIALILKRIAGVEASGVYINFNEVKIEHAWKFVDN